MEADRIRWEYIALLSVHILDKIKGLIGTSFGRILGRRKKSILLVGRFVCKPKNKGGLGIKKTKDMNKAIMLAKI